MKRNGTQPSNPVPDDKFDLSFKVFHELMARSEVMLASRLKPVKVSDFSSPKELNRYLAECLNARRKGRQRGIITTVSNRLTGPISCVISRPETLTTGR